MKFLEIFQKKSKTKPEKDPFGKKGFFKFSKISGKILIIYLVIIAIGTFLLSIPGVVLKDGRQIYDGQGNDLGYFDFSWNILIALFTASSAFSDTGLSIATASSDYTIFGQIIILLLIQLGGFGVLTFKIMILMLVNKKIKISDQKLIQGERGGTNFGNTVELVKSGIIFLLLIEAISAILLAFTFYFSATSAETASAGSVDNADISMQTYHNFWNSVWAGIFHSVSAVNNAGFDIIGNSSLMPYNTNYIIQFIFLFEFIAGGIGFVTFYDFRRKFRAWKRNEVVRFSLFTKINLVTYFTISFIGVFSVWSMQMGHLNTTTINENGEVEYIEQILNNSVSDWNGFMNIFFNTMSNRNAGFSTVDMNKFLPGSKMIMSMLMFIGSSPSSTAGGIRTTTLFIIVMTIISITRNRSSVNAFKKEIPAETVRRAMGVGIISFTLVSFASLIIISENSHIDYVDIFFLATSAFGTTGLNTLGFLDMVNLGVASTIILCILMFVGQLGVSATLLVAVKTNNKKTSAFPEEDINIG